MATDVGAELVEHKLSRLEQRRTLEVAKATGHEPIVLEPYQRAPLHRFYVWLLLAGRMTGKTLACAVYYDRYMRAHPGARGGIVAPTLGDATASCVNGATGVKVVNPLVRLRGGVDGPHVVWPNGSEAKLFGAYKKDDPERLRAGGNRHIMWAEEVAAWRYLKEAWEQMELAMRDVAWPHVIASTTPKTRPKLKEIMEDSETVVTRATVFDNPHVPQDHLHRLIARYGGTRLEAQELLGQYLEDVEGALWTYETIARSRVGEDDVPKLTRVIVAVDPSGGDEEGNDEQGIIVAARGADGHAYVLADRSCKLSPAAWGARVIHAYEEFKGDKIVAEKNFGGDMVSGTITVAARDMGLRANVDMVSASRGKALRAEPISALYEQGQVHHVGEFPELESQMRNWTTDSAWSPDRLDALVFALSEFGLKPAGRLTTSIARDVLLPSALDRR